MKIRRVLLAICIILTCFTGAKYAMGQQGNTSVKISESDNIYRFQAKYDKAKTRKVQEYMTESLSETGFKFTNTKLDASLTLNGGITFYIKSYEGVLELKFDKRKNNAGDYTKFKKMCEGIKDLVGQN